MIPNTWIILTFIILGCDGALALCDGVLRGAIELIHFPLDKSFCVQAHHCCDKQSQNDLYDQYWILKSFLLRALGPFLRLQRRILDRVEAAANEDLQAAVESVAAGAEHELSDRDRRHAQDVIRYAERSKRQAQQCDNSYSFALKQAINCFEISEDPRRLLDLSRNHLFEKVAGKREGDERAEEHAWHRYWDREEESLDLALEDLRVRESEHYVIQSYRKRHDKRQWVQNVDRSDCQKGMRTHPQDEFVEVLLNQFQVEDAEPDDNEESREAEDLRNTLASAAAAVVAGLVGGLLVYGLVLVDDGLLFVVYHSHMILSVLLFAEVAI